MNGFDTVGMSAVSMEELEQTEGGLGLVFFAGVAIGYGVTKALMDDGGGEPVPGLNQFLLGTKAIATAAGGRPQ